MKIFDRESWNCMPSNLIGPDTKLAPVLAAIGALAALLAEFKVEVVRTDGED